MFTTCYWATVHGNIIHRKNFTNFKIQENITYIQVKQPNDP